jgi:metal-sulfur cluster biosynthetic enzyme
MRKDGRIQNAIEKRLAKITHPETGLDVMRMGMIRDLDVSAGEVSLVFRPASAACPEAFRLGADIREAVLSTHGVRRAVIRVENYDRAAELEQRLRED